MRPASGPGVTGVILLLVLSGCGASRHEPPEPGYERGGIPELRGARVMILPLQLRTGGHPDLDQELEYALRQTANQVDWVPPMQLWDLLARSPGTGISLDRLPVGVFLAGEVQRIGDPLFGDIYRLAVLAGAAYALVPVEARADVDDHGETVQMSAALLDARNGYVLWFGVVAGTVGAPGDLAPSATAAEALARRLSD